MHVLIISPSYPPAAEGEAEHALQIAKRLADRGYEVSVLTNRRSEVKQEHGVTVHAVVEAWKWRHLPTLLRRLRALKPDAVLLIYTAWLFDNHPMISFLPTLLRRWRLASRLVVVVETAHSAPVATAAVRVLRKCFALACGQRGIDYAFGSLLRDADTVIVLGPTILATLSARDPSLAQRALLVPPPPLLASPQAATALSREQARTGLGVEADELVLAYFGYVYPGKGVETLFEAVRELQKTERPPRLLMVGGGRGKEGSSPSPHAAYEAKMHALSSRTDMKGSVRWLQGYDSGSSAPSAELLAADMAVLPFDDGAELRRSSIAVVAAMGLPLVTTRPAVEEPAFVNERNMLLVAPCDAVALSAAIRRVSDDAELAARLRLGALTLVRDWYSWDKAIAQIDRALFPKAG